MRDNDLETAGAADCYPEHELVTGSSVITSGEARCDLRGTDDGIDAGEEEEEKTGKIVSSASCENPVVSPSVDVNILSNLDGSTEQVNHKSLLNLTQPTHKNLRYFAFLPTTLPPHPSPSSLTKP